MALPAKALQGFFLPVHFVLFIALPESCSGLEFAARDFFLFRET